MDEKALRALTNQLMGTLSEQTKVIETKQQELHVEEVLVAKLTFALGVLRGAYYGRTAETLDTKQRALFDTDIEEDLTELEVELEDVGPKKPSGQKRKPKRAPIPDDLPRTDIYYEPRNTQCACGS